METRTNFIAFTFVFEKINCEKFIENGRNICFIEVKNRICI